MITRSSSNKLTDTDFHGIDNQLIILDHNTSGYSNSGDRGSASSKFSPGNNNSSVCDNKNNNIMSGQQQLQQQQAVDDENGGGCINQEQDSSDNKNFVPEVTPTLSSSGGGENPSDRMMDNSQQQQQQQEQPEHYASIPPPLSPMRNNNNNYSRNLSTASALSALTETDLSIPLSPLLDHVMEESIDRAITSLNSGAAESQAVMVGERYLINSTSSFSLGEGSSNSSGGGIDNITLPSMSNFPEAQREELRRMYLAGFRDAARKSAEKKKRIEEQQQLQQQNQSPELKQISSHEELANNFARAQQQNQSGIGAAIQQQKQQQQQQDFHYSEPAGLSSGVSSPLGHLDKSYDIYDPPPSIPEDGQYHYHPPPSLHQLGSSYESVGSVSSQLSSGGTPLLSSSTSPTATVDAKSGGKGGSSSPSDSGGGSGGKKRQGHSNPFPRKLFDMLGKEEAGVVGWLPRGDAFVVRDNDRFVGDILPRYFRHTKVSV